MVHRRTPRWDVLESLENKFPLSFRPEEHNRMSSYGFKHSFRNGYSHHSRLSLATLECPTQLVTAGQSCRTKSSRLRWGKWQRPDLLHNSASVRERLRECSFVANLHQTRTPLPSKKCALEVPTQFTGQRNCGEPVCVVEQQSDSVTEPLASVLHTEASRHTLDKPNSLDSTKPNFPKSMGHVAETAGAVHDVIFSTEVPYNTTVNRCKSCSRSDSAGVETQNVPGTGGQGGETCAFGMKKTTCVLQDQIRRVVVNLEEVLRGLKEVELEMKEVVMQIDKLTINIELGEDDTRGASGDCSFSRKASAVEKHTSAKIHQVQDIAAHPDSLCRNLPTVQRDTKMLQASSETQAEWKGSPRGPPPAYPKPHSGSNTFVPKPERVATRLLCNGPKSEVSGGLHSRKPPPYPFSSRARRPKKGEELDLKPLSHSGKRRLLSTTV
ncbi:uncharacterized protein LOC113577835 [Electrophorus electricus]|uniref:uncharacterized protein LOC113577835 n=1 Tax=Electrophorus electricus TaxID=8005 RepID=UPI0015D08742|nr:uncharacterized protein LOC113577835 [Electrophorus electricus]